jgi:uncharacterized membrane protein
MTRTHLLIGVLLTAAALAASLLLYPRLPAEIPLHWDIHGEVNGSGAKEWAAFLLPACMAGILLIARVLPWLSPRHFEVDGFRVTYGFVMVLPVAVMGYVHALCLWAAISPSADVRRPLMGGIFLCIALLGNVLGKVRRNFWIGVRTPWTLANERVWIDTHRFAARLFVGAGIAGFIAILAGAPFVATIALLVASALAPILYSLVRYKRLERRGEI